MFLNYLKLKEDCSNESGREKIVLRRKVRKYKEKTWRSLVQMHIYLPSLKNLLKSCERVINQKKLRFGEKMLMVDKKKFI